MRWRVALEAGHELLRALLALAVGAALAVRAAPVGLGAGDVALVRQQALLVVLSTASCAHEHFENGS